MNDLLASLTGLSGFEFAHPMWFLILPLPLVVYYLVPAYRTKQMAIKVPFFSQLVEAIGETPSEGASQLTPSWWQRATLILSWLLVVCAMAKPTVLGEPQVRESLGRDVMVVVDLSGSMAEPDFTSRTGEKISRLDAAKEVLTEFVQSRKGDRLGWYFLVMPLLYKRHLPQTKKCGSNCLTKPMWRWQGRVPILVMRLA